MTNGETDLSKPIKATRTHVLIGYERCSVIEWYRYAEVRGQMSTTTEEDDH